MKTLHFTQDQVTKILEEIAQKEDGYSQVMKIALESIMRAERELHNETYGDVSNGYRFRKTFGRGKLLELQVPRSRFSSFYPVILALLKDKEEEIRQLAFHLYGAGLTTAQVSKIFGEFYGKRYSESQVSRLFGYARREVEAWLKRPLDSYYPIIYIDATFISVRRGDSVSKEAFYTVLGVKEDRTREVLAIFNMPTENLVGWTEVFASLKERGVQAVGLLVSDHIRGIEEVIWRYFPDCALQLCVIHLQRNLAKRVKMKDRGRMMEDFKEVFRTSDSSYTYSQGWEQWQRFCNRWGRIYPSIKKMKDDIRYQWYFTYLNYDYRIQSMIYSTNWIERLNRDYKRVTRMRGALPNPSSVILLLGHVAMTRNAYERKVPKLLYETKKFFWKE